MTNTTTTTKTDTTTALPEGTEFAWVAPGDLLIDANVRTDVALDAAFLASIRDLGVRTPVLAVRAPDGLHVREGQRRTLAAVETGLHGMPVYIVKDGGDAERIIGQLAENHDRAEMTRTDTAAAYAQLSLLGLSAAQIAKRTRRTKAEVTAGITVAASPEAADAADHYALDLVSAALFAEFQDDEEATTRLRMAAGRGESIAHAAQRLRDARTKAAALDTLKETLTAQGIKITYAPAYYGDESKRSVGALRAKGSKDPLTAEAHATCPNHVAWITYDDDTATATPVYGCADYKASGHLKWTDPNAPATERTPLTDAERAERRLVRENNAAWRSAETVRREWLPTLARRKTPPKGAAEFIARAVLHNTYALHTASDHGHRMAARLLGHKSEYGGREYIADLLTKASTPRAQVITLTVVLAAIEETTSTSTWRHAHHTSTDAVYLTALETWGYDLSDIEQTTCARTTTP